MCVCVVGVFVFVCMCGRGGEGGISDIHDTVVFASLVGLVTCTIWQGWVAISISANIPGAITSAIFSAFI